MRQPGSVSFFVLFSAIKFNGNQLFRDEIQPGSVSCLKGYSHSFRIACDMCAVSLLESRE